MNDIVTATGIVHGKVQGVGFRAFARNQAQLQGVTGYAHNQADGSVAFALTGPRVALEAMLKALEAGPAAAQVYRVDVNWQPAVDLRGFEIR